MTKDGTISLANNETCKNTSKTCKMIKQSLEL